jgi:hypothetical protein
MKNNKLKLLAASSFVALITTGCSTAPAPWAANQGGNAARNGVAHSHNGVVHTHPLPSAGIHHSHRQGGSAPVTRAPAKNNGVPHTHNGVSHSHPLPSSGINHSHGGGQSAAPSSTGGSQAQTSAYDYGSYDYGSNGSGNTTTKPKSESGYYDSEYSRGGDRSNSGNSRDRDAYRYEDAGYGRSKDTGGSSSSYDGGRDYSESGASSSSSSTASSYSGGDYYTVQVKDTVFEVMRKTGAYWKDIIRLNDLKAPKYEIQPGQRLKLPKERSN